MGKILSLLFTAGAMALVWVVASANSGSTKTDDLRAVARSIGLAAEVYRLSSPEQRGSCTVTKGARVSRGVAKLAVDPACDALLPGMNRVRYWRERSDGSVEFTGEGGDALAAFAVADGVGYEPFRPRSPLLSLSSGS